MIGRAGTIVLVFLTSTAFWLRMANTVESPKLVALMLGTVLLAFQRADPDRPLGLPVQLYLASCLAWVASALLGYTPSGSDELVAQVCLALVAWGWSVGLRVTDLFFLRLWTAAWAANGLYSWLQRLHLDPFQWSNPHLSRDLTIGMMGNPDYLATYLAALAPLTFHQCSRWWQRVLWVLVVLTMVLTTVRGSWVSLLAALPFWFALAPPQQRRNLALSLGLLAVLTGSTIAFQRRPSEFNLATRAATAGSDASSGVRLMLWEAALLTGAEKAAMGWGPGHYTLEALKHREREPMEARRLQRMPENPHCQYLQLWVQAGLLGTGLFLAAWVSAGVVFWRRRNAPLMACWVAFSAGQVFLCPIVAQQVFAVWLLAAAAQEQEGGRVWPARRPISLLLAAPLLALIPMTMACELLLWQGDDFLFPAREALARAAEPGLTEQAREELRRYTRQTAAAGLPPLQRALALAPPWERGPALSRLEQAYGMAQMYPEANATLQALLAWRLDPYLLMHVADVLEANKQDKMAELAWQDARHLDPRNPVLWLRYGDFLARRQRPAEALQAYDCSLEIYPRAVDARMARARILAALGREAEAQKEWEEARRLDPEAVARAQGKK